MSSREWITAATKRLGVEAQIKLVEPHRFQAILNRLIATRTTLGQSGSAALWWWEKLREPVASREATAQLMALQNLIQPDEDIWFVAEAGSRSKRLGNFWLYESRIANVCAVLSECPAFEYYIASKQMDWLLCENHHGKLICSGESMIKKFERWVA